MNAIIVTSPIELGNQGVLVFDNNYPPAEFNKRVHETLDDFAQTKDGECVLEETDGYIYWSDVVTSVPTEVFRRHGLNLMEDVTSAIVVDGNESAYPREEGGV